MLENTSSGATKTQGPASSEGRKVEIKPGCIICKTCEFMAPDIFVVEEKAVSAKVLVIQPPTESLPDVFEAIKSCPEKIIKFHKIRREE